MIESFLPMLAVAAEPFDSPEYVFEVKWNGIRALAARDGGPWRLWGRDCAAYQTRYPELDVLQKLPAGTVLDGEIVQFQGALPDLDALLGRHSLACPRTIAHLCRQSPVNYVVFDALYEKGRCLFGQPLETRRASAEQLVRKLGEPRVVFSTGVEGRGRVFFEEAVRRGQEGVMAKHRASRYLPGRRSAAWKKIKPVHSLSAVIFGFRPGRTGFRSLFVAALRQGSLRYVAHLRVGFTDSVRRTLRTLLAQRVRAAPVVACPERGVWVEPDLYCRVRFLEWTPGGRLRGASFAGLVHPSG